MLKTESQSLNTALCSIHGHATSIEDDIHLTFNPYHDELVNLEDSYSVEDIEKILEGKQCFYNYCFSINFHMSMEDMILGPNGDDDFDGHGYDKDFASVMSVLDKINFY